jgi:hypothetical protein
MAAGILIEVNALDRFSALLATGDTSAIARSTSKNAQENLP